MTDPIPSADPAEAAEAYAALGWPVVPIGPGAKYPVGMGDWRTKATDDVETIRGWYGGDHAGHGVGIVTGERAGVWVLDVDTDPAKGKVGGESLTDLQLDHGALPKTVTSISGTGGLHLFFRWDPEVPVTNGMSTRLPADLDIRGEGGQVVAAPTLHPDTGEPYVWAPGRDPWSVEVAEAPGWLLELLTSQPEVVEADGPGLLQRTEPVSDRVEPTAPGSVPLSVLEGSGSRDPSVDSIADWVRERFDFTTSLQEAGWTVHSTRGQDIWWTRPGKEPRHGHSAVLHGRDGPLVVFSGASDLDGFREAGRPTPDNSGVSCSLFDFLAVTIHGGDKAALGRAARELRTREESPSPPAVSANGSSDPAALGLDDLAPEPVGGLADVGHWWDNPGPTLVPAMLPMVDGRHILYLDQLNWLHGDSGSGKTWVLLYAAAQLIRSGKSVLWVHYEDPTPTAVIERLRLLGLTRDEVVERFHYWDPDGSDLDGVRVVAAALELGVAHVCLDSVGEALNAAGLDENTDAEVGPWINRTLRTIVNEGIGCTVVDHAVKATRHVDKLYPSGSKRKRAVVTGASLLIESSQPPTKSQTGFIQITCAKDRHGNWPRGEVVAVMRVAQPREEGDALDVTIAAPTTDDVEALDPIAVLAETMLAKVTRNPGLSKGQLVESMDATRADARAALARLEADGRVTVGHDGPAVVVRPTAMVS